MNVLSRFKQIDTFIFDVDGVLTDGTVLVLETGEMARRMNIKDGYALQLAIKKGYRIFIVSGSSPSAVQQRLAYLGISEIYFNVKDKKNFVLELIKKHVLNTESILFMGDDMPDLPVFDVVGLSCCPKDAVTDLTNVAQYVSHKNGGEGCVREVIEKVMKLNDDWEVSSAIAST